MRGRYEKPRGHRRSDSQQPRYNLPQQDPVYDCDPGYDPNSYDPNGGQPFQPDYPQPEKSGFGWGILSFFLPVVGLILWLVWMRKKPRASKASLIGGLIGLILTVLLVAGVFLFAHHTLDSFLGKVNSVEVSVEYTDVDEDPDETEYTLEPMTEATEEATEAPTETKPHVSSPDDYINFLIVGQSSRGEHDIEQARFADSMMLMTLNTYDNTLTMTSLLRDSFAKMPDYKGHQGGRIKLTTIYHLGYVYSGNTIAGSMELMDMALYRNFGIEVDYNFEVNFDIFMAIIDQLEGVYIEIDQPEADYLNDFLKDCSWKTYELMEPGTVKLDGWAALAFARMRHAEGDADSDIKRTGRQQRMVNSILNRVKDLSVQHIQELADVVLPMISTSMSTDEMSKMLMKMIPILPKLKLVSGGTCPANYKGEMVDIYSDGMPHSVLRFNEKETKEHMRELTLGIKPGTETK